MLSMHYGRAQAELAVSQLAQPAVVQVTLMETVDLALISVRIGQRGVYSAPFATQQANKRRVELHRAKWGRPGSARLDQLMTWRSLIWTSWIWGQVLYI